MFCVWLNFNFFPLNNLSVGVLMSADHELSESLERIQSSDCYGAFNWVHTFGLAQNQKQSCLPNS